MILIKVFIAKLGLAPFHTITKHNSNLHLCTKLLTFIQININDKGYILTRTTVLILLV